MRIRIKIKANNERIEQARQKTGKIAELLKNKYQAEKVLDQGLKL